MIRPTSDGLCLAVSIALSTPTAWFPTVVGTLARWISPESWSKQIRSVNVPPTSQPITLRIDGAGHWGRLRAILRFPLSGTRVSLLSTSVADVSTFRFAAIARDGPHENETPAKSITRKAGAAAAADGPASKHCASDGRARCSGVGILGRLAHDRRHASDRPWQSHRAPAPRRPCGGRPRRPGFGHGTLFRRHANSLLGGLGRRTLRA